MKLLRAPEVQAALGIVWLWSALELAVMTVPYLAAGHTWGIRYGRVWLAAGAVLVLAPSGWWYHRRFGQREEIQQRLHLRAGHKIALAALGLAPVATLAVLTLVVAARAGLV